MEEVIEKIINKFQKKYRHDLRQECHIKALELLPKHDPDISSLKTYLWKPLYNCCIDHIKLLKGNLSLSLDNEVNHDEDTTTFAELLEGDEDIMEDYLVLPKKNLPKREEINIMIRYYEGYSPKEILNLFADEHNYTNIKSIRTTIKKYNDLRAN